MNRVATLTALMVVVTAVACTKDTTESIAPKADGEISLSTVVSTEGDTDTSTSSDTKGQTRAPLKDETGSKVVLTGIHFLKKDGTPASGVAFDFGGVTAVSGNRDATGKITFASPIYYDKVEDKKAYFVAYWPSKSADGASATVTAGQKVVWTVDGKTDILISTLTPTGAFDAGKYSAPEGSTTMLLYHALAQLEVVVKAVPTTSASLEVVQAMWGEIRAVTMMNTPNIATYTYADNALTYGSDLVNLNMLNTNYSGSVTPFNIQANSASAVSAVGMYASNTTGQLRLRITSAKFPDGIEVPVQLKNTAGANCDFEAGKRYVVTLTLGADDKKIEVATTAIDAWSDNDRVYNDEIIPGDILLPSEGILDMRYNGLIKTSHTTTITSTQGSYNGYDNTQSNAAGNGGYAIAVESVCAESAYYKLEVDKDNLGTANWATAWEQCKTKAPAGEWRLPRATELTLMFRNRTELEKTPGFVLLSSSETGFYWSGSERSVDIAWGINPSVLSPQTASKTDSKYIRCVRELREQSPFPSVEDYYYTDGTFSRNRITDKTVEGVVYWVDTANLRHFKVVGMNRASYKWSLSERVITGATSLTDGKVNTLKLMRRSTTEYPAAKWCYDKNTGLSGVAASTVTVHTPAYQWYLPARSEIQHLFSAYRGVAPMVWQSGGTPPTSATDYPAAWNTRVTTGGGTSFASTTDHWSSSEYNDSRGWVVSFYDGGTAGATKDYTTYETRCVKEIGRIPPAVGHFYFTDGDTSPTLVSGKTASGVVYYVDSADPSKFKVFSLDQGLNLKWSPKNTYVLGASGQSLTDGKGNVAAMKAYSANNKTNNDAAKQTTGVFATDFPAAAFCEAKNTGGETGWYLPAKEELKAFYDAYDANKTLLDAAITTGGGTAPGGYFWSSTEYSDYPSYAWRVSFSDGNTNYGGKNVDYSVRCVREN